MNLQASIIIPTYNYADYIGRAIDSVLAQQYPAIEIIVVDDGSTDDTRAVVEALQQQIPFLQYHAQPNSGKAVATQQGIALANSDFICTLDADDWLLPGKLAATAAILQQYPSVVHVASPALIQWQQDRSPVAEPVPTVLLGQPLKGTDVLQYFFQRNMLFGGGSTFAIRTAAAKQIHWQPAIDMYTDEWLVIAALLCGDTYFLPEPYSVWWVHQRNYSGSGGEALLQKQARLRQSSNAVLQQLAGIQAPMWLQNAYQLKHDTRELAWQEASHSKTLSATWAYIRTHLLSGRHSISTLWHYHAFHRLLKW